MTVWPITEMTGYEPKTTYWNDLETAELFGGEKEIRGLCRRAKKQWGGNIEFMTELCMVLNWRLHLWYQRGNQKLAKLYEELWSDLDKWILECEDEEADEIKYKHFTKEEIAYFLRTVD